MYRILSGPPSTVSDAEKMYCLEYICGEPPFAEYEFSYSIQKIHGKIIVKRQSRGPDFFDLFFVEKTPVDRFKEILFCLWPNSQVEHLETNAWSHANSVKELYKIFTLENERVKKYFKMIQTEKKRLKRSASSDKLETFPEKVKRHFYNTDSTLLFRVPRRFDFMEASAQLLNDLGSLDIQVDLEKAIYFRALLTPVNTETTWQECLDNAIVSLSAYSEI